MGFLILIALGTAHGACEETSTVIAQARDALFAADFDGAKALRQRAEASLACGTATSRDTLAQLWVVEGVLAGLEGDEATARLALTAAQRTDAGVWDPAFGEDLTALWSDLSDAPPPTGTLEMSPALGEGWTVLVDGAPQALPHTLPDGLHAVQVLDRGKVMFGRMVRVPGDETVQVSHTLPVEPLVDAPPGFVTPDGDPVRVSLVASLGLDVAGGQSLEAVSLGSEPNGKVLLPGELGVAVEGAGLWVRGAATLGPLLTGTYVFAGSSGPSSSPVAVGGHLAGGPTFGAVHAGLLAGVQWPGRIPLRAVGGLALGDLPLRVELRAGINVTTDRPVEPAGGLVLSYVPWL